ncbi:MAG: ABC transporter ATP-binding protein [Hyphomicrobiales bacterium]|nr:ABC transporter ATP-binding protein [Hyphomicrobiales bacterium]
MLEVSGLTAGFGTLDILHDVSLTVASGEFVGLLGANNAGKSTLVNCLSGLVPARRGTIRLDGEDISGMPPHRIVERGIVQVPEGRLVFPQMSVLDNLKVGSSTRRSQLGRTSKLEEVFALFPRLHERMEQPAGTLSGGEQQMLAIGRGLLSNPRLLMLDEPSLGLSPLFVQTIFRAIKALNTSGLTILLVEQNLNLTLSCASRSLVLERGKIVIEGTADELRQDPQTRRAYLGL